MADEVVLTERPGAPVIYADRAIVVDCGAVMRVPLTVDVHRAPGEPPEQRIVAWLVMPRSGFTEVLAAAHRLAARQ